MLFNCYRRAALSSSPGRLKKKLIGYSRANNESGVHGIVVAITIVETHVPRVKSGVLSGRPMVACAVLSEWR